MTRANRPPLAKGFPAAARADAKALILGSMPGKASLQARQYYAHPRNAFWKIMAELFGFDENDRYPDRLAALQRQKLALWDVLKTCRRASSMDADIVSASGVRNDFDRFFAEHAQIRHVFFNGAKAEQLFRKSLAETSADWPQRLHCLRLPSTSPAYASLSYRQKLLQWREALRKSRERSPP